MRQPRYKILNYNRIEVITEVANTYDLNVLRQQEDECLGELTFISELIEKIETSKKYKRGK